MRAKEFIIEQKEYIKNGFLLRVIVPGIPRLDEALKLPIKGKVVAHAELGDFLYRINQDKKTDRDKTVKPIIHKSTTNRILKGDDPNDLWDLDELARIITTRPTSMIGTNNKMKKSIPKAMGDPAEYTNNTKVIGKNSKIHKSGIDDEVYYDITLPAIKGLVVDEETGDFVEVSTCPNAADCQIDCYARKGGYVQWEPSSIAGARLLNFLVNDPDGFMGMVEKEITKEKTKLAKKGKRLVFRWHDAGDFFSTEYAQLASDMAKRHPDIETYAYTKNSAVVLTPQPENFVTRFSTGASHKDIENIKSHIASGNKVRQAHVVPKAMFKDLLLKGKDGKVSRDKHGALAISDMELLKQRIGEKWGIDPKTILTYYEMQKIRMKNEPTLNVITVPGQGDEGGRRRDVLNNFMLFH